MHDLFSEANKFTQFKNKIHCAINNIVTVLITEIVTLFVISIMYQ